MCRPKFVDTAAIMDPLRSLLAHLRATMEPAFALASLLYRISNLFWLVLLSVLPTPGGAAKPPAGQDRRRQAVIILGNGKGRLSR